MKRFALSFAALFTLSACGRGSSAPSDAATGDAAVTSMDGGVLDHVARAEDLRQSKAISLDVLTNHDVAVRRAAARALARIADGPSVVGLLSMLGDEDPETVAWAAYGLGFGCKNHEEPHVRALAARAASLPRESNARQDARGTIELDPRKAIARAIGRCGAGLLGEQVLVALLKSDEAWHKPAVLGLGDLAVRRKELGAEAMTALLDLVGKSETNDVLFYPLSRVDAGESFAKRVFDGARTSLSYPAGRIFAIKVIARAGGAGTKESARELLRIVSDTKSFSADERGEAARGLGMLGEPGRDAAADALALLTPDKDGAAIGGLVGTSFHVLYTLIASLGPEPPKKAEPALNALANMVAPSEPKPALARRLAELRCAAALGLARGVYDAEVLRKCDAETSETSERARLASLLRRPLAGERKAVFRGFTKSEHLRVREAAIESIAQHPELGEMSAQILADALQSKNAGIVATAAEVVHMHPERARVLADSEKKAALDPKAPPPTDNPAQQTSKVVSTALGVALAYAWPVDRFETRIALFEAAASVGHPDAKKVISAACNDPNSVVRERAQKALRALGEQVGTCGNTPAEVAAAPELGHPLPGATKVTFRTELGELRIVLEPDLAPVTTARLASLVKSGFFKGNVVHRVVPGFVVQFGDPEADGYGGSGTPLRCETSPVPFKRLDVGMALAGRDTGSSQIFVTLSRTPHLDGEYARIGYAEGEWESVAEGDILLDATIAE